MKHILELPWGSPLKEKYALKSVKGGYAVYSGVLLPRELRPFRSEPFSIPRWTEDEQNAHVSAPDKGLYRSVVTDPEKANAEKILEAYTKGFAGSYHFDQRTDFDRLALVAGVSLISKEQGVEAWTEGTNKSKLLIVTTKSFMNQWKMLLMSYPFATAMTRTLIIDYSQLNKLIMAPANARLTPKKSVKERALATHGTPTIDWDFIIFDQAHRLGSLPKNQYANQAIRIAKLHRPYKAGESPFSIFSSKKFSDNPQDYSVMSKLLAPALGESTEAFPEAWPKLLKDNKFFMYETSSGWLWLGRPPTRGEGSKILKPNEVVSVSTKDSRRMLEVLESEETPHTVTDFLDRPVFHPFAIELKGGHKAAYEETWGDFREWLNFHLMHTDDEGYKAQSARYAMRVNRLKERYLLELTLDLLAASGTQVVLEVPTIEAVEFYGEKLTAKKVDVDSVDHRTKAETENVVNNFRRGRSQVLLTELPVSPRMIDVSPPPIVILTDNQALPAFTRNNKSVLVKRSPLVLLPYFEKTLEEKLVGLYVDFITKRPIEALSSSVSEDAEKVYRITAARTKAPNRLS